MIAPPVAASIRCAAARSASRPRFDGAHGLDCLLALGERWRGETTAGFRALGLDPPDTYTGARCPTGTPRGTVRSNGRVFDGYQKDGPPHIRTDHRTARPGADAGKSATWHHRLRPLLG